MIGVVAYNANNFSTLLPTTRISTLISLHVCFSALMPTTPIIFLCCRPQHGKISQFVSLKTREFTVYERRGLEKSAKHFFTKYGNTHDCSSQRRGLKYTKGLGHEIFSFCISCVWGNKLQFWPKRLPSLKKRGQNDRRCCLHSGKIIGVVANNAEKCSNLNISTNLKPYANLH
jgi:hypothetical protein